MSRKQDPLSVEFLLLGIIRKQPIHAYDLDKMLKEKEEFSVVWRFNQSQLYAILDKLEKNNLIQSEITQGSAFPFRKIYTLTQEGEDAFQAWKVRPVEKPRELRSDFLVKLYFLKDEPYQIFESVIKQQIMLCNQWIELQNTHLKNQPEDAVYLRMVYQFRLESLRSNVTWLNECLSIQKNEED